MEEGMAYGCLPVPDTGCPVRDVYIYYVPVMINVWDTASSLIHLPWVFSPTDIFFWTKNLIIQNGPPLYPIYMLNLGYSAGELHALQLVLLAAFRAVDEPPVSCMMVYFRGFVFQK